MPFQQFGTFDAGAVEALHDLDPERLMERLADEIVRYFRIFDLHDVWEPEGATALARWLLTKLREPASDAGDPHGTFYRYRSGCRCAACVQWKSDQKARCRATVDAGSIAVGDHREVTE